MGGRTHARHPSRPARRGGRRRQVDPSGLGRVRRHRRGGEHRWRRLALAADGIIEATGLTAGFVGAILLGVVNALPETVTAITAVRRGALTLAIGAILGGNAFDALNVAIGDTFYRGGSLYHRAGPDELFLTLASSLMTVVVAGLLVRQTRGPGRVDFEGIALITTYAAIIAVLSV